MKKLIYLFVVAVLMTGCASAKVNYGSLISQKFPPKSISDEIILMTTDSNKPYKEIGVISAVGKNKNTTYDALNGAMIQKARENAKKYGYKNVEFKLGDIENLPVEDNSVDAIISNCVINLSPDKSKVFKEAYRALRKGGKIFVSDMVLLKQLTEMQKNDNGLIAGCVGGAVLKEEYLRLIKEAGFEVEILSEDKEISDRQYKGFPVESLKLVAHKK